MQSLPSDWIRLRWEKEGRYYEAHLHQDLWGQWVVTRAWGQRNGRLGRVMNVPCASHEEGLGILAQLDRSRRQKGYRLILKQGDGVLG